MKKIIIKFLSQVIYEYFPRAIDRLDPDQGLFPGPRPKILLVDDVAELTVPLDTLFLSRARGQMQTFR